jgi:hypothetical protein
MIAQSMFQNLVTLQLIYPSNYESVVRKLRLVFRE